MFYPIADITVSGFRVRNFVASYFASTSDVCIPVILTFLKTGSYRQRFSGSEFCCQLLRFHLRCSHTCHLTFLKTGSYRHEAGVTYKHTKFLLVRRWSAHLYRHWGSVQAHRGSRGIALPSRAGLDGCGKSHIPPGFDPRTVQPVASRYTDWAIPALR
jgi:hypothetical protein